MLNMLFQIKIARSGLENLDLCRQKISMVYPTSPDRGQIAGLILSHVSDNDYESAIAHEIEGLSVSPEDTKLSEIYVVDEIADSVLEYFDMVRTSIQELFDRNISAAECMAAALALVQPEELFELYDHHMLIQLQE